MVLDVLDVFDLLQMRPSAQAQELFQQALRALIIELADSGKVIIIGRAACVLLRARQDVFHVRLVAPIEQRVARIARLRTISHTAAQAQIEASDRTRRAYLHRYYHAEWDDPQLYDLVLNMEKFTVDTAAEVICLAYRAALSLPNTTLESGL
jgi:CMP/dCMP kinase